MFPTAAKVVVIGGGVLGTSAAFNLANAGHDVVLLERGPIAGGTTPFAAGQTGYLSGDRSKLEYYLYCIEFFENFEERTGYAIEFRQNGSLRLAMTEHFLPELESRMEAAKSLGHSEVEWITPAQASERVPALDASGAKAILFVPRDGFVDPKSVAVAYAAAARDRGAAIFTRTPVTGLDISSGQVNAVHTERGTIQTEWVVLAAGAWARQFGQRIGLNIKAVPVLHQAFVTAPIGAVVESQPIVRVSEPQIYVRPWEGGLLCGGYGYRPLSFDMNDFPDNFEMPALPPDRIYYHQLAEAASRFFPALREAVVVQERRALPTIGPDAGFMVSELKQAKGLIVATSDMQGGISRSPGIGHVIADIVSGNDPWPMAAALDADRFGDEFNDDTELRARCEDVYSRMYHSVI